MLLCYRGITSLLVIVLTAKEEAHAKNEQVAGRFRSGVIFCHLWLAGLALAWNRRLWLQHKTKPHQSLGNTCGLTCAEDPFNQARDKLPQHGVCRGVSEQTARCAQRLDVPLQKGFLLLEVPLATRPILRPAILACTPQRPSS